MNKLFHYPRSNPIFKIAHSFILRHYKKWTYQIAFEKYLLFKNICVNITIYYKVMATNVFFQDGQLFTRWQTMVAEVFSTSNKEDLHLFVNILTNKWDIQISFFQSYLHNEVHTLKLVLKICNIIYWYNCRKWHCSC